jgi:hypothetical protein
MMGIGLGEQIERRLTHEIVSHFGDRPWAENRVSKKWSKIKKLRRERRRGARNPQCQPEYRRYRGYEW